MTRHSPCRGASATSSVSPGFRISSEASTFTKGDPPKHRTSIRQAATQLHELKASDEEGAALAGLARALLAERKSQEAEQAIQEALAS